jgi:FHA domain
MPIFIDSYGREVRLASGPLRIGREPDNDIVILDSSVSRYHATLSVGRGATVLNDNESSNGTYVGNRRLSATHVLDEGDRVRFGNVEFTFRAASGRQQLGRAIACEACHRLVAPTLSVCPHCGAAVMTSTVPLPNRGYAHKSDLGRVQRAWPWYLSNSTLLMAFLLALPVAAGIAVARRIETRRAQLAVLWGSIAVWILLIAVIGFISFTDSAINHYNKGIRYMADNPTHPDQLAEQQFKIAIDKDPDFAEAHMNLGVYYLRTGWLDGAEKETKEARDIFEQTHETKVEGAKWEGSLSIAYNNLGVIAVRRIARDTSDAVSLRQEGVADFKKALELDPNNAQAHVNLEKYEISD